MALVSYDYGSSDSENEENEDSTEQTLVNNGSCSVKVSKPVNSRSSDISDEEEDISDKHVKSNMFDTLPEKKVESTEIYNDEVEDFIPKAPTPIEKKGKVKISIPALSDFDNLEDLEPSLKKIKPSSTGSGLLSLLPPVKTVPLSNKSFVPHVLKKLNKAPVKQVVKSSKTLPVKTPQKTLQTMKAKGTESDDSDVDIDLPETFDEELWQKSCGKVVKKDIVQEKPEVEEVQMINIAPETEAPYEGLDNEAFKELVGKNRRMPQNIKLVDINEEELVAEKDLWMTKSLTDPEYIPKKEVDDCVDTTKKKKHHITYLAQQAKANEQELKTQWAASKYSRNQTRAKYGF